jgi:hypothetical protein
MITSFFTVIVLAQIDGALSDARSASEVFPEKPGKRRLGSPLSVATFILFIKVKKRLVKGKGKAGCAERKNSLNHGLTRMFTDVRTKSTHVILEA